MSFVVEVPARSWVEPDRDSADADAVLAYLRSRAGVWVSARDAARDLGMSAGGTEPRFRRAVRVLVLRGAPVSSGVRGFVYCDDPFVVRRAARELRDRADALLERAQRMERFAEGRA